MSLNEAARLDAVNLLYNSGNVRPARDAIMNSLDDQQLTQLLHAGETDRVERKESATGKVPTSIREAICAFANDLPGHGKPGVVLVGVKDNGDNSGLPVTDELLRQLADMKTDGNIVPPPTMTVEKRHIEGADIAVITVQPSDSPPVRYRGRIFIRTGPRRGLATAQDERILNERRRFGDRPFDLQPIPTSTLRDLNLSQFENEYLVHAFSSEVLEANERTREERLAAAKMIAAANDPTATVLGLLVLGKSPIDFIPGAYVQFLRIAGNQLADPIVDSEEIGGTVSDILRRLDDKLKSHNRTSVDFVSSPVDRRTNLYPIAALQQILRNAIMHRSYEATNAPVRVTWFNDRIEIMSPGGPFGTVTTLNFGQAGVTDYRNPNLAEAMKVMGFVQRFGVGIPTARRLLKDAGHPDPEFVVDQSNVLAVIRAAVQ